MKPLVLFALGLFSLSLVSPVYSASDRFSRKYDLRIYGPITAEEQPPSDSTDSGSRIRLTAQDHAKAEILLSKILSDFTTLPTVTTQDVTAGETTIPALCFQGGRRILPVLRAKQSVVDLYLFDSPDQLTHFLSAASRELQGATKLPGRSHPFYMEFWDRHCMGFWYRLFTNSKGQTDNGDFEFLKRYELSVNAVHTYSSIQGRCDSNDLGFKMNRWFDVAPYAYASHPEAAVSGDPDLTWLPDYYGDVPFGENPIEHGQVAEMMNYIHQFTNDEHFVSVTDPHGETGPHNNVYLGMSDRGEPSRQDLIHYLRDLRKIGLSELGKRWYGAPSQFKSWNEVSFPREREFYGWKDGVSQDLAGTWKMHIADRAAGEQEKVYEPGYDDSRWLAFEQPGTQYLMQSRPADRVGGWLRFTFTPDPSLVKSGSALYLTLCPFNQVAAEDPVTVYLNGEKIGDIAKARQPEWGQIDIARLIKPGANVVAVYAHNGCIQGPAFLTLHKAEPYPTSDTGLNARLFDVREWVADHVARANVRYFDYVRGIDPNRPIKMMSFDSMTDVMMPYLQTHGGYPHCTGEGAFLRPWYKRYGYLRGIPDSSEPGGPAKDLTDFRRYFFIMTFEGMNAHDYFWDLKDMLDHPDMTAWYEKNVPYLKLMGRFDLKKPDIAIARSFMVDRVTVAGSPDTQHGNDPGRGDFQQAHQGFVFCSERDLRDHLVDDYKVIVDCNWHTLNPEDRDALEAWVRKGGTLVLNQRSGRNTYLEANAWPIAQITGCAATIRPQTGTLKFENAPLILKSYAGRTFENKGESLDWQKTNYFSDSIALEPQASDVSVIARYDDGKPAIVLRSLGKGRVLVLGSAFYRHTKDEAGIFISTPDEVAFYKALFKDLGVAPLVESDQDQLWSERFVANNGSTELLVLANQSSTSPLQGASATWDPGFAPRRVFDPVTGADLPVRFDGNKVVISGLDLSPLEMRYFAVERTDWRPADAVKHWLFRQSQLWHAVPQGVKAPKVDRFWPVPLLGDFHVKQFDSEPEARKAMEPKSGEGEGWKALPPGNWASMGLRTGPEVWGVYRKKFIVTREWLTGLRGANLIWRQAMAPGATEQIAVNGIPIVDKGQEIPADGVLAALKPGENLFTLIGHGRKGDGDGGFMGDLVFLGIPCAGGKTIDLSNDWTVYRSDTDTYQTSLPAEGNWIMVRKSVKVPTTVRKGSVWIEVQTKDARHAEAVSVNGRLRYASNLGAPFKTDTLLVNITPDIRWDRDNDIVIGGNNWLSGLKPAAGEIQSVHLICVPH